MDEQRSPLLGSLTVVVAASLFGMLGVLARTVYGLGLTPFGFVTWRAGVGAIATGAFVVWGLRHGRRLVGWRSLNARGRISLGVAGLMGATLNTAMFLAFARVPVAIVLLCFYVYPALVAGVSALLGWESLDRLRAAALLVALSGMVAVVAGGPAGGPTGALDPVGVGLALSTAASQAVFVMVSRHGYREVPTEQAMGVILAISAAIAAVLAVGEGGLPTLTLPMSSPGLLGLLLFGGLFAAAIPSFLFLAGIRAIGPIRAGILMLIEPLVGVMLAALFLSEGIGPIQAAGGVAILVAAVLIQRAHPAELSIQPAAEPEPDDIPVTDPSEPGSAAPGSEPPGSQEPRVVTS